MDATDAVNSPVTKSGPLLALILFSIWLAAFIPVYSELIDTWLNHSNNSHGLLVPLISAYLIWQKRDKMAALEFTTNPWGAVILTISMLIYIFGYAGAIAVLTQATIVCSLIGIILFNFGRPLFSLLRFPLFYLFFMIPVPDSVYNFTAFPLQLFATKISAFLISGVSIPAYREGNMLYFVETQLEVAEACSGLRSMMSFIMLAFLFAYLMKGIRWKRVVIVLTAVPLAIFSNIVRVTGTGILAHFYGGRVARGFLHEFSGLVVFAFGFVLLFAIYYFLENPWKKRI